MQTGTFLLSLLLGSVVLAIAISGIAVKVLTNKGEFRGSCASNNPMLKSTSGECSVCGSMPGEDCGDPEAEAAKA